MWPSYRRRDATLSLCSTHRAGGHYCWIYSRCQCVPCYFIKLIYSTTAVRRDAPRSWPWCACTQTPWPESPLHLCLSHLLPSPRWCSRQLCSAYGGEYASRRCLWEGGWVTPVVLHCGETFAIWDLPGLAVNLCAAFCLLFHMWESVVINKQLLQMSPTGWHHPSQNSCWICCELVMFLKSYFTTIFSFCLRISPSVVWCYPFPFLPWIASQCFLNNYLWNPDS